MNNGWHACVLKIDPVIIGEREYWHGPYHFQRFFKNGYAYLGDPDDVVACRLLKGDWDAPLHHVGPISQYYAFHAIDRPGFYPTVLDFLTADAYRDCLNWTDVQLFTEIGIVENKLWAKYLPPKIEQNWQFLPVEQKLALFARAETVRLQDDPDSDFSV